MLSILYPGCIQSNNKKRLKCWWYINERSPNKFKPLGHDFLFWLLGVQDSTPIMAPRFHLKRLNFVVDTMLNSDLLTSCFLLFVPKLVLPARLRPLTPSLTARRKPARRNAHTNGSHLIFPCFRLISRFAECSTVFLLILRRQTLRLLHVAPC